MFKKENVKNRFFFITVNNTTTYTWINIIIANIYKYMYTTIRRGNKKNQVHDLHSQIIYIYIQNKIKCDP